jgi:hypothetical protein
VRNETSIETAPDLLTKAGLKQVTTPADLLVGQSLRPQQIHRHNTCLPEMTLEPARASGRSNSDIEVGL